MTIAERGLVLVAAAVASLVFAPAPAARAAEAPPSSPWQLAAGLRLELVRDAGYDPFAANDVLPQLSLSVTRALSAAPDRTPFAAVGLVWDTGGSSAHARGTDASLSLMRLGVALEGRFGFARRAVVTARLLPAVQRAAATVADPSAPAPLRGSFYTFALDASAGAALCLSSQDKRFGLWLTGDTGYSWAPTHTVTVRPALASADASKAGETALGSLATRGPFLRFAIALAF